MKKIIYTLITGIMAVTLTACGSNDEGKQSNNSKEQTETAQSQQQEQEKQMKEMQKLLDKQKIEDKKIVAIIMMKRFQVVTIIVYYHLYKYRCNKWDKILLLKKQQNK